MESAPALCDGPADPDDAAPYPADPGLAPSSGYWSTPAVVLTGLVCFLGGALTWHLVGFWTFVSAILYNPDPETSSPARPTAAAPPVTTAAPQTAKAPTTVHGLQRPHVTSDTLADLLQCAEARKSPGDTVVTACPPLRRRLPMAIASTRGNRQLDAREAARRLATGWETGVAPIETGSLPGRR